MDNNLIGVFDSGLGGISLLNESLHILPNESFAFIADEKNFPFGTKTKEEVIFHVKNLVDFLKKKNSKAIVAACNTSIIAYDTITRENPDLTILNVVDETAKEAYRVSKNKRIGLICTPATLRSEQYHKRFLAYEDVEIIALACENLAPYIENNECENIEKDVEKIVDFFADKNIDTLILGCTHYNLIYNKFEGAFRGVNVVSSATKTIEKLLEVLREKNLLADSKEQGEISFYSTLKESDFSKKAKAWLQ